MSTSLFVLFFIIQLASSWARTNEQRLYKVIGDNDYTKCPPHSEHCLVRASTQCNKSASSLWSGKEFRNIYNAGYLSCSDGSSKTGFAVSVTGKPVIEQDSKDKVLHHEMYNYSCEVEFVEVYPQGEHSSYSTIVWAINHQIIPTCPAHSTVVKLKKHCYGSDAVMDVLRLESNCTIEMGVSGWTDKPSKLKCILQRTTASQESTTWSENFYDLNVGVAPGVPNVQVKKVSTNFAKVRITPDSNTNFYNVFVSKLASPNQSCYGPGDCFITGLENNTDYTLLFTAVNDYAVSHAIVKIRTMVPTPTPGFYVTGNPFNPAVLHWEHLSPEFDIVRYRLQRCWSTCVDVKLATPLQTWHRLTTVSNLDEQPYEFHLYYIDSDGQVVWRSTASVPVRQFSDGAIIGLTIALLVASILAALLLAWLIRNPRHCKCCRKSTSDLYQTERKSAEGEGRSKVTKECSDCSDAEQGRGILKNSKNVKFGQGTSDQQRPFSGAPSWSAFHANRGLSAESQI